MSKVFSGKIEKLDNPKRREIMPPEDILLRGNFKKGDEVIDFGCGIGYFSIPASRIVGDGGIIYAIDLSNNMLDELEKRKNEKDISNIELINSSIIPSTILVDKILIVNVLHEVGNKDKFLISCKNALKLNGEIIIIDFQKKNSDYGPPIEHRISKEDLIYSLKEIKFNLEELQIHDDFYFIKATM